MGWLPSNNTCSTLSSQSALSTSSRGTCRAEDGGGGWIRGHRGGKLDSGSPDGRRGQPSASVHPYDGLMSTSSCRKQVGSSGCESRQGRDPAVASVSA